MTPRKSFHGRFSIPKKGAHKKRKVVERSKSEIEPLNQGNVIGATAKRCAS